MNSFMFFCVQSINTMNAVFKLVVCRLLSVAVIANML